MSKVNIFWFRRDLRLEDNAGLYYALKQEKNVLPLFIFDSHILEKLESKIDKRVDFIYQVVTQLQNQLLELGSGLIVRYGKPLEVFKQLYNEFDISSVYINHDYEPDAISRDNSVGQFLNASKIPLYTYKDQVIFEKEEIVKDDGSPYTVFTPYSNKWKLKLNSFYLKPYANEKYYSRFLKFTPSPILTLTEIGFQQSGFKFQQPEIPIEIISKYTEQRDFPSISGTSKLSAHLRFGTVSIRKLGALARECNETWLNELIWRDFYMCILYHFPYVAESAFKKQYNSIEWRNNPKEFEVWCNGQTGYPIVDAGMRELNATGFMHNRVRMIVASFLTKHLLIDWRWGAAYFASKLLDFDLAANNGGWQWAAGCGCDAAPYFRIFNPYEQTKKFDNDLEYIRKWVPEFEGFDYPMPIVNHKFARERALAVYKKGLQS
jgi:deoxyribodipyrimidine photo-lyase